MAEVQDRPDGEKNIRAVFSQFDNIDINETLNISEMKHVLANLGDPLKESELDQFFDLVGKGGG
jgi:Ca2+-binding EF-hand superfamily protein